MFISHDNKAIDDSKINALLSWLIKMDRNEVLKLLLETIHYIIHFNMLFTIIYFIT